MSTPTFVIFIVCFASIALADDFKTINGKEYKDATVSRIEPDGLVLKTKSGISKVYFTELPKEVAAKWLTNPILAAQRAAEEKRVEQQKAAERERAEKEKKAEAALKRTVEEFQTTEQRASETYQSVPKGMLSGQVFVSTSGGENFKLGAVQIGLFARDAIDTLLAGVRKYADFRIQQLSGPVAEAKAAKDQAEANEKAASEAVTRAILAGRRDYEAEHQASDLAITAAATASHQYSEMKEKLSFCYSGGFYFTFFQSPIRTAETDAEGKFVIEVPRTGAFVIAAQAKRSVWIDTEHYYWVQPVSLEGREQLIQNLSNKNLTSTTGTSSLILTQD